jgi:AraC family transcriptional regulator, regulatory protein of adaptative response / DNA-3-methyladenine glycosylase II
MPAETALPDDDACYLALQAKDARFDGLFFTGVTSTGIYCRPVCRVRTPRRENCRFFSLAAQAEGAGFRPCLRCRPELAPRELGGGMGSDSGSDSNAHEAQRWSSEDASRVLALSAARWLDEHAGLAPSMTQLSAKLGVSDRHVRRLFEAQFGVSPLQYLQTRRLLMAKQLLTETALPVSEVAFASGFDSVRRFNAAFTGHYGLQPTGLRRSAVRLGEGQPSDTNAASITLQLAYRAPYDVQAMMQFMAQRAIDSQEVVDTPDFIANYQGSMRANRSFSLKNGTKQHSGWLSVEFDAARHQVRLTVGDGLRAALPQVITRVRRWLDLDADPMAIDAVMARDFPGQGGVRVPGCLDGFELAVRAVLGQQITVQAARTLAARLVARWGEPLPTPHAAITRLFPSADALAQASPDALGELGIVRQRQAAIQALARAVASGELDLNHSLRPQHTIEQLMQLPGIGAWTAQYIAMRALRWPDAFPAGDIALHNAFKLREEKNPSLACEALSQRWRPWRSYAVIRAWRTLT